MSIAYLDPGNVESDLQAGAAAEYKVIIKVDRSFQVFVVRCVLLLLCDW